MGGTGRKRKVADGLPRYLERRAGGVYGCRIDVPQRLRSLLGKSKYVVSHSTTDLATALVRHKPVVARLLGLLEFSASALDSAPPRLNPVQLQATARRMTELYLARYQGHGQLIPAVTGPLADLALGDNTIVDLDRQAIAEVSAYRRAAGRGGEAITTWRTTELHQAQELLSRVWHPDDSATIATAHHRAKVLALRAAAGQVADWQRWLEGQELLEAMPDPAVVLHQGGQGFPLEELGERWIEHRKPAAKTAAAVRRMLSLLAAVNGTSDALQVDVSVVRRFRDGRLQEVTATTTRKELALLRAAWSWGVGEGLLPANPFSDVRVSRADGNQPRQPFNSEQVALILKRSGEADDAAEDWSWPLGLMLGLRIEEICCLRRQDLQLLDGIRCVVVDPEGQLSGALKTRASERTIPLPEALVELGFWDWALQQKGGYLFDAPSIPAADPRRSHSLSIRNGKALRRWGINSKRLVFHSCRHTFAARAVQAGLPDRLIQTLMGHSTGKSMTARYSGVYTLAQLKAGIDQLDWPE